jgi:hypothetical protein
MKTIGWEPPQQPLPLPSNPIIYFGSCPVEEEILPPEDHTPSLSFHPEIAPLRVHTPVHGFNTGGCIVEEEISPSWQMENQLTIMDADLDMDVESMKELPKLTPLQLSDEHLQLIF